METNYRRQERSMKTAEIIRALRCTATVHVDDEPECSVCPYFIKDPLPEGFYLGCDIDKICIDAAARLESIRDGRWISVQDDDMTEGLWRCSECGGEFFFPEGCPTEYGYKFCPNCGAQLDPRGEGNG